MKIKKITINTIINANIQKVWEYYTLSEHITKWNFALDTWHCPYASNDLRIGGKFVARMETRDGSIGFDFEGVYNEVIKYKKIAYTMPDNRQVQIYFNQKNDNTEVVIIFDAEQINPLEMQRDGWQAILNNFKKYVETT